MLLGVSRKEQLRRKGLQRNALHFPNQAINLREVIDGWDFMGVSL